MTQGTNAPAYLNNIETIKLVQAGDSEALARMIEANSPLVHKIARKFIGRGIELEDLVQIGSIGLLRAVRTFDLERGTAFSTYAVPLILGEIRRFLRDDGAIKVSRNLMSCLAMRMRENEAITKETGVAPNLEQLAERCGISVLEAAEALEAQSPVQSFSDEIGGDGELTLGETIPAEDAIEPPQEMIALIESLSSLPPLWRRIVTLRYYRDLSQKETARLLGLTQVKISREEKKIFTYLREKLGGAG